MFFQPPDDNSQIVQRLPPNKKNKKSKKKKNKKRGIKKETKKTQSKFANTMSAWAENFAVAATWQLKHQVAYWKARAKALQYENEVLHDVIRRNHFTVGSNSNTDCELRTETEIGESDSESEDSDNENEINMEDDAEDNGLEVSEEFIQFLTANAKFKEDAKRERERLNAKMEEESKEELNEQPRETLEENRQRMSELYGDKWQRISALEMSLLTSFISESDQNKSNYWPNIPLNFNCS